MPFTPKFFHKVWPIFTVNLQPVCSNSGLRGNCSATHGKPQKTRVKRNSYSFKPAKDILQGRTKLTGNVSHHAKSDWAHS